MVQPRACTCVLSDPPKAGHQYAQCDHTSEHRGKNICHPLDSERGDKSGTGEWSVCIWASSLECTCPCGPFPGSTHMAETELGRRLPGRDRRTSSWTLDKDRAALHSLPALDPRPLPLPVLDTTQLIYTYLVCTHSVARSCRTLCELTRLLCPWGFFRQEYRSGFPSPPPGSSRSRD